LRWYLISPANVEKKINNMIHCTSVIKKP
jgi:hypothetical protein